MFVHTFFPILPNVWEGIGKRAEYLISRNFVYNKNLHLLINVDFLAVDAAILLEMLESCNGPKNTITN